MRTIKLWLVTIAVLLCSISASAHDFEQGGIYYKITSSTNLTLSVTCKGNSYSDYANEYTGEVTIPSQVYYNNKYYNVTRIRTEAFKECTGLTTINIRGGVTYIESNAFEGCTSLSHVTLNDELAEIGSDVFLQCSSLKNITLPKNLKYIGYNAFIETGLESIIIPKSVESIQRYAFNFCPKLKSIKVENGNTIYDSRNNCNAIIETATNKLIVGCNNTIIPNTVEEIDDDAFVGSGISSISIPEKCTKIGFQAFSNCSELYSVTIYGNVKELVRCFHRCISLESVSLPNGLTTIGSETFKDCSALLEIQIPNSVTSIGGNAFSGCTSLTEIQLPESLEKIEYYAFTGCKFSTIDLPNGIKEIGEWAFYNCSNINSVSLPSSLISIHRTSFENTGWYNNQPDGILYLDNCCLGYKSTKPQGDLVIRNGTRIIGKSAFVNCYDLTSISIPKSVNNICSGAFDNCTGLTQVNLPSSITSINNSTFYGCKGLTSVNIPNSVTSIGSSSFQGCSSLESIAIPTSVTSIGSYAFGYCSSLTSITLPNSITSIPQCAFYGCSSLASVNIPSSVTSIEGSAFNGCSKLTEIICQNPTPPLSYGVIFSDVPSTAALYIPLGSRSGYSNHSAWNNLKNIWEQETFVNSYIVTYVVDEEIYKTETVAYGTKIIPIEKPTKLGYSFVGWNDMPEIMPAKDITVYGTFVKNKYLVTFRVGDEIIYSEALEYGSDVVTPEAPQKEGMTFIGWGDVVDKVPAHDVTYEGNYSLNSYKLTYKVNGEILREIDVDYGSVITPIAEPIKEGHTFSGWSEIPSTMPASDVEVNGTFFINNYLVTFKVNDMIIFSESFPYGTSIIVPEAPQIDDYEFVEWIDLLETVPAYDVEFYAAYKQVGARIADGITSFEQIEDIELNSITYTRTLLKTNTWNALYLPFEIPMTAEFCQNYDVAYFNDIHSYDNNQDGVIDGMDMEVLKIQEGTVLNANHPYLIRAKNTDALNMNIKVENATLHKTKETTLSCSSVYMKFDVTGIYTTQTAGELKGEFDVYAISGGGWKQALNASQQLKPFRLYLKLTSIDGSPVKVSQSALSRINIRLQGEDSETGILEMESEDENKTETFDLSGRRVQKAQKGLYIVNGKKVIK